MEIDWVVKQSIETTEKFHEKVLSTDLRNIPSRLQLAELKDKLGNTKRACWHFQKALDLNIDEERRWYILEYLAAVKTKNKTLDDVDVIIEHMKQLNISYPKPDVINERKAALAVERGKVALRDDKKEDAIELFKESTTLGNINGAKLLLDEVKQMDRENRNVYIYCAHIDVCIENSLEEDKELSNELQENISKLLSADSSSVGIVLQDLREAQFRMERSVLQNSAQLVSLRVEVIHKCRTILNQTMTKFRDRHYKTVDSSCDYFNIPKCSSVDIANKVKKKLQTSYKWAKFSERFPF
ncbi:uncharacterized protein [Antedon mediterranea]|uniref:uncharacterized protein n=1 Tax=Antedon mediterranea TaxID=105859 RepID=UPI003AF87CC2